MSKTEKIQHVCAWALLLVTIACLASMRDDGKTSTKVARCVAPHIFEIYGGHQYEYKLLVPTGSEVYLVMRDNNTPANAEDDIVVSAKRIERS